MNNTQDDIVVWEEFRKENKDSLGKLFMRHYDYLFKYGIKLIPERDKVNDTIQELFIDLWIQKNPPPLFSPKAYLLKALRYKLLKIKKQTINMAAVDVESTFEISHENFIIQHETNQENTKKLMDALCSIPAKQREIIYLRFYLNLGYQEICEVMNIEYQVARNQVSSAIKNIKKILLLAFLILMLY